MIELSKEFTAYCEDVRKTLKSTAIDLETQGHMLEETIENWKIYEKTYDQLDNWLAEGERILQRSADKQLVS